jgi:hypothetical protein
MDYYLEARIAERNPADGHLPEAPGLLGDGHDKAEATSHKEASRA